MGIRKLFRTKRHCTTSSQVSPTFVLPTDFNHTQRKKKNRNEVDEDLDFIRRAPQRSSSSMSEHSRSSFTSNSSSQSSISFSETVEVQEIAPLFALTDTPEELWYQQEEYSIIQKRIRQLARYAETQEDDEDQEVEQQTAAPKQKKVCTRGLEWMKDGRSMRRQEARKCVLMAQRLQFDDEGMALAYESVTRESVTVAQERAWNDAKAIELYLRR